MSDEIHEITHNHEFNREAAYRYHFLRLNTGNVWSKYIHTDNYIDFTEWLANDIKEEEKRVKNGERMESFYFITDLDEYHNNSIKIFEEIGGKV